MKSPAARRCAPTLMSAICRLIRRDTYQPMSAAMTATTRALIPMLPYSVVSAWLTLVRGSAVRSTVVIRPFSVTGMATYIMSSFSV